MKNPIKKLKPSLQSALILLLAMLIIGVLIAADRYGCGSEPVEEPKTAAQWLAHAESLAEEGNYADAERACRAALAEEPRHPGAARKLTLLLLRRGDIETIIDWMDDLVLRDARLAEQIFELSEFRPFMDNEQLRALQHEARIQARD